MAQEEKKKKAAKGKPISDSDLWAHAMREAKPLQKKGRGATLPKAPEKPKEPPKEPVSSKRGRIPVTPLPKPTLPKKGQSALSHGEDAGIDRRLAQRFKRGQLPIEATLDLHGLRQEEAHRLLESFVLSNHHMGRRCLLVVTGKGLGREEGGVLRRQVPNWLNQAPLRGCLLAFSFAQQHHGGSGALYLLLKRKRQPS